MTDQPEETVQAPPPGAAPVAATAQDSAPPPWEAPPPVQAAAPADVSSRVAALEAELAKARADAVAGAKVLLRVLLPHTEFTHGGHTVGDVPTPVPASAAGPLMEAAGQAGVTLEEA